MRTKIVSFNIRYCDDKDGNVISERAPRLFEVIRPIAPDLIGFQEYRPEWEAHVRHYFGDRYEMFCKYRSETTGDREASPVLWKRDRFELIDKGYFWLSDTPDVESRGWDEVCNCFRMCVYVTLKDKKTGNVFNFMNTHFGFGDNGQVASARLIYERYKSISEHPTFIVGDFNMLPDSAGYKTMTEHFTDVNAVTVNDRRGTYHGYHPETIGEHIDYCFVDEQITPVGMRIIDDAVDGKYPSDHFGLAIELSID